MGEDEDHVGLYRTEIADVLARPYSIKYLDRLQLQARIQEPVTGNNQQPRSQGSLLRGWAFSMTRLLSERFWREFRTSS